MALHRFIWRQVWGGRYLLIPILLFLIMRQMVIRNSISNSYQQLDDLELDWNKRLEKFRKIVELDEKLFEELLKDISHMNESVRKVGLFKASYKPFTSATSEPSIKSGQDMNSKTSQDIVISTRKEQVGLNLEANGRQDKIGPSLAAVKGSVDAQPRAFSQPLSSTSTQQSKTSVTAPRIQNTPEFKHSASSPSSLLPQTVKGQDQNQYPEMFYKWWAHRSKSCGGRFVAYDDHFAYLTNVMIDPTRVSGARKGGEQLKYVMGQPDRLEYLTLQSGCFRIICPEQDLSFIDFKDGSPLKTYAGTLSNVLPSDHKVNVMHVFTIAVTRHEYFNLYHTMTDWYNTYLLTIFFQQNPTSVHILIMDAHPWSPLDNTWLTLFSGASRLGFVTKQVHFDHLVWGMTGYDSPLLSYYSQELPYAEEFRAFFLGRFSIPSEYKTLNCSKIELLLVKRKPYIAHARQNATSHDHFRIFSKVDDIINTIYNTYGDLISIRVVALEDLSMEEQLKAVTSVDIMLGVHGAALTHALFLPKHAALLEIFPRSMKVPFINFSNIAQWRGLKYHQWHNQNANNEDVNGALVVPPLILQGLMDDALLALCPNINVYSLDRVAH